MKPLILVLYFFAISFNGFCQKTYTLQSPDSKLNVQVSLGDHILFGIKNAENELMAPSEISMTLDDGTVWGKNPILESKDLKSVNTVENTPFYIKSTVKQKYNELKLRLKGNYELDVRVYNEGAAYRFATRKTGDYKIISEQNLYRFNADDQVIAGYVKGNKDDQFINSFENTYNFKKLDSLDGKELLLIPALIRKPGGYSILISESDLKNYPGMYLQKNGFKGCLSSVFAPCPAGESATEDVQEIHVKGRNSYLAAINGEKGGRTFPWRLFAVEALEKDFLTNDLAYLLSSPSVIKDISWIKPGKASWDWWSDWNLSGVNFRAGVNDSTYSYHIDFAASNKLEYILLDAGWYEGYDAMKTIKDIHLPALIAYGKSKNVGIWLWLGSSRLFGQEEKIIKHYADLGIKGFKIDFFDRDDQLAVDYVYKLLKIAAKHHLMLDLHGMFKPCGMQREYPNLVGMEGVFGLENLKWTHYSEIPAHLCTLPFTRMFAGMMDYTPGAMRNATKRNYSPVNELPMSQGTRCQQLALYAIDYVPLQMLADNPSTYMKEQECTSFISKFPTVWDKTVSLAGKAGDFVAIAREKNGYWYAGCLTNWEARDLTIDCSFLGSGPYLVEIFQDGINADRRADDYKRRQIKVNSKSHLAIHMAPGGGWAAIFSPLSR